MFCILIYFGTFINIIGTIKKKGCKVQQAQFYDLIFDAYVDNESYFKEVHIVKLYCFSETPL